MQDAATVAPVQITESASKRASVVVILIIRARKSEHSDLSIIHSSFPNTQQLWWETFTMSFYTTLHSEFN